MKELLLSYAAYNAWANGLLLDVIRVLPEETQRKEVVSSFPSLRATLLHLMDAESMWWQRLQLQEKVTRPSETFEGDGRMLAAAIQQLDLQWLEYVTRSGEHVLEHVFHYQNTKREQFKQPVWQMLQHLFNHSTYHRGQLVTMLRQVGELKRFQAPTISPSPGRSSPVPDHCFIAGADAYSRLRNKSLPPDNFTLQEIQAQREGARRYAARTS
jgi:uncharacterized damage-inducible protein DinB